jgi:hypothetical protein
MLWFAHDSTNSHRRTLIDRKRIPESKRHPCPASSEAMSLYFGPSHRLERSVALFRGALRLMKSSHVPTHTRSQIESLGNFQNELGATCERNRLSPLSLIVVFLTLSLSITTNTPGICSPKRLANKRKMGVSLLLMGKKRRRQIPDKGTNLTPPSNCYFHWRLRFRISTGSG